MSAVTYLLLFSILPIWEIKLYSTHEFSNFIQAAILGYAQFFAYALLYYYFTAALRKERELRLLHEQNARIEKQRMAQELDNVTLRANEMKAQQEKLAFEYAYLQSQINPHFLYNALNVLFSQALKVSEHLATNISNMSEIIRYSMESVEYKITTVPLQKELEHLQILIDINAMRFGNPYYLHFNVEGSVESHNIPPLCFITIVENAFKYGDIRDRNNPLQIIIRNTPDQLYFFCKNKKKRRNVSVPSHQIGIKNLRYRLDAAFHDSYQINLSDEGEFYTFTLHINHS